MSAAKKASVKAEEKKVIRVSVDNTFDEVLKYDQEGHSLVFDHKPGKFVRFTEEQFRQLSAWNQARYTAIQDIALQGEEDPLLQQIQEAIDLAPNVGSGKGRLAVMGLDTNKYAVWWERPDRLAYRFAEGWKVCDLDGVRTLNNKTGRGLHRIGKKGEEELVLLYRPIEMRREEQRKRVEHFQKLDGAVEQGGASDVRQGGYEPVTSKTRPEGEEFKPVLAEEK